MLDADNSVKTARRALRSFMPDEKFSISSLKDPTKLYNTWVFQCKAREKRTMLVCKLSTPDDAGRARIKNQYDRLKSARANLGESRFTSPEPLAYSDQEYALIMEYVDGETLAQILPGMSNISESPLQYELSDFMLLR